jgi:DNA-directed RNA polymerase beta' subunit
MATSKASQAIRENAKKDRSPKWDGADTWTGEQFTRAFREAMTYYNSEFNGRELKPQVINWMGRNGFPKDQIVAFKDTSDGRCTTTMGAVAACLNKGMPAVHPDFNKGRDSTEWLKNAIREITEAGKEDQPVVETTAEVRSVVPVMSIQDRIREQAAGMSEELDAAIDSFLTDPDAFDPKAFKVISLLRGKGVKAAQSRYIKGFFAFGHAELKELASGKADEQLREAYSHHPRKNIKKLIDFYESIMLACDQIAQEAKVLKKPRAKKAVPADKLVAKLKFKTIDDKLGLVSVPAVGLIGAQSAVVYNTKTRKIGIYISKTSAGLSVKGTSIIDFTDKSFQKTLRKPTEQLREYKEQNTQKRVIDWFTKIKSTDTVMNGRMNADIMILKIFK